MINLVKDVSLLVVITAALGYLISRPFGAWRLIAFGIAGSLWAVITYMTIASLSQLSETGQVAAMIGLCSILALIYVTAARMNLGNPDEENKTETTH